MQLNPAIKMGLGIALIGCGLDQLSKSFLLYGTLLAQNPVRVLPFMDFVLVWNKGVSYGLFTTGSLGGRIFLIVLSLAITGAMIWFLAVQTRRLTIWAYGLIIGGAFGNIIDRIAYGAVVDFISLHGFGFYWYVFNLADIWISCGVVILLIDMCVPLIATKMAR